MSNKKSNGRAELEETTQTQRGQNRGQRRPKVQPGEKKQTDEKIVQSDPRNGRRATNRFITERKRAGDALQQSEERFRILFDEALDGICLADAETGLIIDCNQALAALVGRERAELIGQPQKTLHPSQNDKAAHSPTFRQHLNDKEGQTLETQVVTSTGIIRDVEIKAIRLNLQGREMLQGIFHDITERKRIEEKLEEERILLRTLIDNLPDRVFVKDVQGRKIISNIADWQASGGKTMEDVIGKTDFDTYPPELAEVYWAVDKTVIDPGISIINREEPGLDTQGNPVWVLSSKVPLRDGQGKVVGLVGIGRDITKRKRAEEALRESEEKYRTILENIEEGYFEVDIAGNFTFFNGSVCRLLGYSREEMMGMNNRYYTDKTNAQKLYRTFNEVYRTGVPAQGSDWELIRKDNTKRYVECSVSSIKNKSGQPIGFRGIIRDITERKQAREKLEEERILLRTLIDNLPDRVFVKDVQGRKIISNIADWQASGGKTMEDVIGKTDFDTYPPELAEVYWAVDKTVIDPGISIINREEPGLDTQGNPVWVLSSKVPLRDGQGKVVGLVGIGRDITERKRAEEALRESENRLHTIVEGTQALLVSVDANGHFTYANDATARALGYASPEELTGKSYLHFIHPEDRQQVLDTFINQANTRQLSSMQEFRIVDTAGKVKWFSFLSDLEIKDGQVVGQSGVAQDITERKRAESERQALLEIMQAVAATESLQELLELIRQSLAKVIYAENFFVIFHNRSTGLFEEVFAVDKYDPPMPPSKLKKSITSYVFRTGEPLLLTQARFEELATRGEVELVGTNSASWLGAPLKMPSETIGVIAVQNYEDPNCYSERDREFIASVGTQVAQAIDRKRVEQALQESEASLREAQALGQVGNWEYDVESQKITWSDQVYKLYERDPVLEPPTAEEEATYYSPEQAQMLHEYARRAVEEGQVFDYDLEATLPSERRVYFSAKMRPVKDASGQIVKLFGTVQDITERKRAEEEILNQVETLEALYGLSRKLSEIEDFNTILDLITRCSVESAHVTFTRVLLLEQDDLVVRAAFPVRVLDQDLQVGQREPLAAHPLCQRVLEENTPRVLQADSPEAGECAPFFLGIAQTLCIVPLHVREQPFGLLMLGEARAAAREPFTVDKIRLACSVGDQAASTLHRALLHEETERRLQRITALRTIDSTIAASMDIRMTLSILLEQVTSQLKVDAASVLLLNPHMQMLEYAAGRGFRSEALQRTHLRLGEGYAGRAALERKLVHIPDLRGRKTDFLRSPYFSAEGFVAYYGVPLIAKGQVKGVLEVFHRAPLASETEWVSFMETLAGQAAIAIDNTQLFDNLQRSNVDLALAYDATIEGWSAALDLRDKETEGHSLRVTEMTMQLARSLGIGDAELVHVRRGALLHDIGKMGVPDTILLKPDKLTDEEWVLMRKHPQLAFDMLAPITYLKPALDIPYCHHEKWDGTGYPRGMKGEEIPLSARIFAVVDVYDALISDRPYRRAWTREKTISHIGEQAGSHFDPEVVKVFLKEFANEK